MFITNSERKGTCYFEFKFCKNKNYLNINKIDIWSEDSLYIKADEFNQFYKLYGNLFEYAFLPNGKKGFCAYGINYYDKNASKKILFELRKIIDDKYLNLIEWLEISVCKYNGFYILGI